MADENKKALKERQAAAEEREKAQQERQAAADAREDFKVERALAQRERFGLPLLSQGLRFAASNKKGILEWLVSEDFTARHSTIGETHSANTGTWLLEELRHWFNASGPRLIICKGVRMIHLQVSD